MSTARQPSSPIRPRRGAANRRRIEEAAAELFTRNGYTATSMQAIADSAGVHVQTIYLAYRTKAAVLAGVRGPSRRRRGGSREPPEPAAVGARDPSHRRSPKEDRALRPADPERQRPDHRARRRAAGDGRGRADVAAFLDHMERGRREGPLKLLGPLADDGALRPGLTPGDVADIAFTLASPDTVRALTRCGWRRKRMAAWLTELLVEQLLPHDRC